jgi:tetratricopeptide (TPR) repeat protein
VKGFVFRKQKAYRIVIGVLIYSLGIYSVTGSISWSAPAPAEEPVQLSAQEKEDLVRQGVEQYEQGDHDQAQENLELANRVWPENYAAPYYLGLIYLEQGKRTAAIAKWRQYVKMDPNSENALRIRKNLTLLLRAEARDSARSAVANEATLIHSPTDENTVAISAFKNLGSENIKPLGKGMAALLIYDLSLVPDLQVVERVRMQVLLEELKLGTSGLVDAGTAPKIGKLLKARHVTSGSLADLEKESLQIASAMVNADQAADINTQEAKGELKAFYDLEKDIACQIVEDLGKSCDDAPPSFFKIHTKSLAALILFAAGLDYLDRQQYDQARDSFQEALDEDPSFYLAQQALLDTPVPGIQYMSAAGGSGLGTTDEMIAMAAAHGISADAAGTALATSGGTPSSEGGVGIVPLAGIIGGTAAVVGLAAGAGGGSDSGTVGSTGSTGPSDSPVGQCNEQQISGGDTADQRLIEMGQNAGTFSFFYQTYTVKDQIIVSYEGRQLLDTGCVGSSATTSLTYSGNSTQVFVEVIPNCEGSTGTSWTYTASCP